jgi:hypothetical protein
MRIRRLTLRGRPLTEDKCHTLSDSPLVRRCESLTLCVDQRKDILVLVNDMPTLRALYLLDENIDEGLIQWLREHLPPSCVVSSRSHYLSCIRIWLS